jgi:hypothetical protein
MDDKRVFRRAVESYAFVDALEFTEAKNADGVVYSEQSVTLNKIINGNARSTTVGPAQVPVRRFGTNAAALTG